MSKYYGVERSSDFLAHYGVKGMRWGVQKARNLGLNTGRGSRKLAKQYAKAQKRLAKLNKLANVNEASAEAEKYTKASKGARVGARIGLGAAAIGSGVNLGIKHILKPKNEGLLYKLNAKRSDHESFMDLQKDPEKFFYGAMGETYDPRVSQMKNNYNYHANEVKKLDSQIASAKNVGAKYDRIQRGINPIVPIGVSMAIGGYGYSAYAKHRANKAKSRMSGEGHRKAVAERNAWQREMNKAFAGTKYASKPRHAKKHK